MTKIVKLGNLKIGGKYPVRIKGMLKTPSSQIDDIIKEAVKLKEEGAEAVRVAVQDTKDVKLVKVLKEHVAIPLVADIHFNYRLALLSIEEGFSGIRLNPLNINKRTEVEEIAEKAKKYKISIRVGINSGGFKKSFSSPKRLAQEMVKKADEYIKILEKKNFSDIMISLKGSEVSTTIFANRLFSQKYSYPIHLGITATGPFIEAIVKSSIGVGILLSEGIGNAIRVSLTAPSFWEIKVAKYILQTLNIRRYGYEIISCPTCSRCEVNLIRIVDKFKQELEKTNVNKRLRIAIMGCVVNGPGEAAQADIGVAFGKRKAAIFRKDKILGWTDEDNIIKDLLEKVEEMKAENRSHKTER